MHTYSLDSDIRRVVYVTMWTIAVAVPAYFEKTRVLFGLPPGVGFPLTAGTLYGVMRLTFDKWVWRSLLFPSILGVPDLNGAWNATGQSSYEDPETKESFKYTMNVKIRQTFSKLEVFAESGDSTSRSTMASICTDHAVPIFRYAFENTPKNTANPDLQRHPGLIELRIQSSEKMTGDYFSGKHRLRFGELCLERKMA